MCICPKCRQRSMPPVSAESVATARACQNPACGYVEELRPGRTEDDVR